MRKALLITGFIIFTVAAAIFVDTDGNIVEHKRGPMPLGEIREKINKLLSS